LLSCLRNLCYALCNAVCSLRHPELCRLIVLHDVRKTLKTASFYATLSTVITCNAETRDRVVEGLDLQLLACWELDSNPARGMDLSLPLLCVVG
jgi:hypothetical protein